MGTFAQQLARSRTRQPKPVVLSVGSDAPGLDLRPSTDAAKGALIAEGCRLDHGTIEGIETPLAMSTIGAGVGSLRGISYHQASTGTAAQLAANQVNLYHDGTAIVKAGGSALSLSGSQLIRLMQDGQQTFFADGGATSPTRYIEERDATGTGGTFRAFELQSPATPGTPTLNITPGTGKILALDGTEPAGAPTNTGGNLGTGWRIVAAGGTPVRADGSGLDINGIPASPSGGFHLAEWHTSSAIDGKTGLHIDVDGSAVGDAVYYDFGVSGVKDLRNTSAITVKVMLTGEGGGGRLFGLCLGESAYNDHVEGFDIAGSGAVQTVRVDITKIKQDERNAIRYVGIIQLQAKETVLWAKDMAFEAGVVGEQEYVLALRSKQGTDGQAAQLVIDSAFSTAVSLDTGKTGSTVKVTFTNPSTNVAPYTVPVGYEIIVARREKGVGTKHHYVGTASAGDTFYSDGTLDVSTNQKFSDRRGAIPVGGTCVVAFRRRLFMWKAPYLYVSAQGNYTEFWPTTYPEHLPALRALNAYDDTDPITIPLGEIGNLVAMAEFGIDPGGAEQYQTGLLLMTDSGRDVLLQGDIPPFDTSRRKTHQGCSGLYAWCHDGNGNVVKVNGSGDVVVVTPDFEHRTISTAIETPLHAATSRSGWVLVFESATTGRLTLCADVPYVYQKIGVDEDGSERYGWTTLDPASVGTVTCAATYFAGDGGRAILGGSAGTVKRLYNPGTASAWTYETRDVHILPASLRVYETWCKATADSVGSLVATVALDGDTVSTANAGQRVDGPRTTGERARLRLTGASTAKHRQTVVSMTPWET